MAEQDGGGTVDDDDDHGDAQGLFRIDPSHAINGGLGLRAARFIAPGTVVLTEEACLVGPSTPYACVECLAAVVSTSVNKCSGCGHPFCKKCRYCRN